MLPDGLPTLRDALRGDGIDGVQLRKCLESYALKLAMTANELYNHYDTPLEWLEARDVQEAIGFLLQQLPKREDDSGGAERGPDSAKGGAAATATGA